jgi:hypothetical protein
MDLERQFCGQPKASMYQNAQTLKVKDSSLDTFGPSIKQAKF